METTLYNQLGEQIGMTEIPAELFDVPFSADVVHEVVQAQISNARKTIAHTKGRGDVRGGGKKPWKQKGTGRARHASIRSPIWKGGGVAFGPTKERNFSKKINRKLFRKALAMVLSSKLRDGQFFLLDTIRFQEPKTKEGALMLKNLKILSSSLIVTPAKDRLVERALRNISRTEITDAASLNVKDMMTSKYVIMSKDAIPVMSRIFSVKK